MSQTSNSAKSQLDARDVPVSARDPQSMEDYETALHQFQSFFGDPPETLALTLQRDPEFVLGHIFNANAMLMMSERQYLPAVRESLESAKALAAKSNDREKALVEAAEQMLEGHLGLWDAWLLFCFRYARVWTRRMQCIC